MAGQQRQPGGGRPAGGAKAAGASAASTGAAKSRAAKSRAAKSQATRSQAARSQAGMAQAQAGRTGAAKGAVDKAPGGRSPAGKASAAKGAAGTTAVSKDPAGLPEAPRWLWLSTLILSLAGLGVSVYLTIEHFTTNSLAGCPENSTINCTKVTTSAQSVVFGIFPVAVLGLAFFVFMVAANTPWAWRWKLPAFRWVRLASVVVGVGFVLYLVYAELFQIQAICLYCTSVHVLTFLLFVPIVFDSTFRHPPVNVPAPRR